MFYEPWIWLGLVFGTFVVALAVTLLTRNPRAWAIFTVVSGVEAIVAAFFAPTIILALAYVLAGLANIFGGLALIVKNKKPGS